MAAKRWKKSPVSPVAIEVARQAQAPRQRRCGRCGAEANHAVSYPGLKSAIPAEYANIMLWSCTEHHRVAAEVVIGWCEAKNDQGSASRLRESLEAWEHRRSELLPTTP